MTHGTAALYLSITVRGKKQLYQVHPIPADTRVAPKAWRLSKGKESYDVAIVTGEQGTYGSCTCPDSVYRSHECKHLLAAKAVGLIPKGPTE